MPSHSAIVAAQADLIAELGFDGIDLNTGCPDRSVEKQGCGAAMIKTPEIARAVIRAAKAAGKPVVFYCTDAACPDAQAMAERIAAKGHDVSILEGGFATWKEAGLPTE